MDGPFPNLIEIAAKAIEENPLWLEEVVDEHEAARMRGVAVATLRAKRSRGGGPKFVRCGSRVGYTRRAILEDIQQNTRASTSDEDT